MTFWKFEKVLGRPSHVSECGSVYWEYEGLKIRLADHESRPTYEKMFGEADIDLREERMTDLYYELNRRGLGFDKELERCEKLNAAIRAKKLLEGECFHAESVIHEISNLVKLSKIDLPEKFKGDLSGKKNAGLRYERNKILEKHNIIIFGILNKVEQNENLALLEAKNRLIVAIIKNNVPFQRPVKSDVAELPYDASNNEVFEKSNCLNAALHMANIKSSDPRYYEETHIPEGGELRERAKPATMLFRVTDKESGEYKEKYAVYYNAAQIANIKEYEPPVSSCGANDGIKSEKKESPVEQLREDFTQWQVALAEGKSFAPTKTNFTQTDYVNAIKALTDKELAEFCNESYKNFNLLLEGDKTEKILKDYQNQTSRTSY